MIRRDALSEYVRASLWVLPTLSVVAALAAGAVLSAVNLGARSPLAFQGTPDDARNLLIGIAGTMVTVIALLLGLAVVALQLSSTQFSPRLLRNFLRDRPNQIVLSVFVATFAYSAAGLYTVGVSGGNRTTSFPRLAVSGAIALLFLSLACWCSSPTTSCTRSRSTRSWTRCSATPLAVIRHGLLTGGEDAARGPGRGHGGHIPAAPATSRRCTAGELLAAGRPVRRLLRLRPSVGEHVVAGTVLAGLGRRRPDPTRTRGDSRRALDSGVRIGFERTLEQDAALGIRQLVDTACKALSPAVNDPYTAVQAIDHLSVIFCALARRPLGDHVARHAQRRGGHRPRAPVRRIPRDHVRADPPLRRQRATVVERVAPAARRLRRVAGGDPEICAAIEDAGTSIVADAEREVPQPADLVRPPRRSRDGAPGRTQATPPGRVT